MALDEAWQLPHLVTLIQHIAAHDHVKQATHQGMLLVGQVLRIGCPIPMSIRHGWQIIKTQILSQETARQRMTVAGGHVHTTLVTHHAGQRQPTSHLKDALIGHQRARGHVCGQLL
jgi:hypothetical protein